MAVHRPAGPTCAWSVNEIDLALRNPNDGPLQAAIVAALESGEMDRQSVGELLETEGPPVVAADDRSALRQIGTRDTRRCGVARRIYLDSPAVIDRV